MNKLYTLIRSIGRISLLMILTGFSYTLTAQCLSGGSSVETDLFVFGSECNATLDVTFNAAPGVTEVSISVSSGTVSPTSFSVSPGSNTIEVAVSVNCAIRPDIIVTGFNGATCGTLEIPYDAALPVELTEFRAKTKDDVTLLEWATASEYNTQEFILERSLDGSNHFQVIGNRSAVGFTELAQRYQLIDRFPPALAYYRLRIVDFDGSYDFSNVIAVTQKDWEVKQLRLGPNPIGKEPLAISFEKTGAAKANVIIMNSLGEIVWRKDQIVAEGLLFLSADLSSLPNGIYHLAIRQGQQVVASQSIIKTDSY